MQLAGYAVKESDLTPRPDKGANKYTVKSYLPGGRNLTVLPDGTLTGSDDDGEYQIFTKDGAKVGVTCSQYPTGAYALPLLLGV
jgi:hypothetical protein